MILCGITSVADISPSPQTALTDPEVGDVPCPPATPQFVRGIVNGEVGESKLDYQLGSHDTGIGVHTFRMRLIGVKPDSTDFTLLVRSVDEISGVRFLGDLGCTTMLYDLRESIVAWWQETVPAARLSLSPLGVHLKSRDFSSPVEFLSFIEFTHRRLTASVQAERGELPKDMEFYPSPEDSMVELITDGTSEGLIINGQPFPILPLVNPLTGDTLGMVSPKILTWRDPKKISISYAPSDIDEEITLSHLRVIAQKGGRRDAPRITITPKSPTPPTQPVKVERSEPRPSHPLQGAGAEARATARQERDALVARAEGVVATMVKDASFLLKPETPLPEFKNNRIHAPGVPDLRPETVIDPLTGAKFPGVNAYPYPVFTEEGRLELRYSLKAAVELEPTRVLNKKLRELREIYFARTEAGVRVRTPEEIGGIIAASLCLDGSFLLDKSYKLPELVDGRYLADGTSVWEPRPALYPGTSIPLEGVMMTPYPTRGENGSIIIRFTVNSSIEEIPERLPLETLREMRGEKTTPHSELPVKEAFSIGKRGATSISPLLNGKPLSNIHPEELEAITDPKPKKINKPTPPAPSPERATWKFEKIPGLGEHITDRLLTKLPPVLEGLYASAHTLEEERQKIRESYDYAPTHKQDALLKDLEKVEDAIKATDALIKTYAGDLFLGCDNCDSPFVSRGLIALMEDVIESREALESFFRNSQALAATLGTRSAKWSEPSARVDVILVCALLDFIQYAPFPTKDQKRALLLRHTINGEGDRLWKNLTESETLQYDLGIQPWITPAKSVAKSKMNGVLGFG